MNRREEVIPMKTIVWVWDPNHFWPGAKGYPIEIANKTGHMVLTVESINSAIDTIEGRTDIDLMISETYLPYGESALAERTFPDPPHEHCNVITLLDAVAEPGLPVIIVSPTFVEEDRALLEPRNEVKVIFKVPPPLEELLSAVDSVLAHASCAR